MLCDVLAELIGRPVSQSPAASAVTDHHPVNASDYGSASGPLAGPDPQRPPSYSDAEPKKRRKSDTCEGTDDDWEFLLGYVDRTAARRSALAVAVTAAACSPTTARYNTSAVLFAKLPLVFYALHLFYEDQKLCATEDRLHVRSLGELLYRLAMDLQLDGYSLHYFCDQPALISEQSASILTDVETRLMSHQSLLAGQVPSVLRYLCGVVTGEAGARPRYPWVRGVNDRSRRIVALTNLIQSGVCTSFANPALAACIETVRWGSSKAAATEEEEPDADYAGFSEAGVSLRQRVVRAFLRLGVQRADIERLPLALQILFVDYLEECRCDATIDRTDPAVCELLLRPDLLAHAQFEADEAQSKSK